MPWYVITRGAVRVAAGTAALIVALTEPLAAQALRSSSRGCEHAVGRRRARR